MAIRINVQHLLMHQMDSIDYMKQDYWASTVIVSSNFDCIYIQVRIQEFFQGEGDCWFGGCETTLIA
jgi:hypothetical protein